MVKHLSRTAIAGHTSVDSNPLYCTWNLTPQYADSRSSSLWCKTSQGRLASPAAAVVPDYSPLCCVQLIIIRTGYQLKSMKVTLHSHHTPSLLLSNDLRSTPWQDIWNTSELRFIRQGDAHDFSNIKTQAVIKFWRVNVLYFVGIGSQPQKTWRHRNSPHRK